VVLAEQQPVSLVSPAMVVASADTEWLTWVPATADEKSRIRVLLDFGQATAQKVASVLVNAGNYSDVTAVAATAVAAAEADSENLAIQLVADAETEVASATQQVAEHAAAVVEQGSADSTKVAHCLANLEDATAVAHCLANSKVPAAVAHCLAKEAVVVTATAVDSVLVADAVAAVALADSKVSACSASSKAEADANSKVAVLSTLPSFLTQ